MTALTAFLILIGVFSLNIAVQIFKKRESTYVVFFHAGSRFGRAIFKTGEINNDRHLLQIEKDLSERQGCKVIIINIQKLPIK